MSESRSSERWESNKTTRKTAHPTTCRHHSAGVSQDLPRSCLKLSSPSQSANETGGGGEEETTKNSKKKTRGKTKGTERDEPSPDCHRNVHMQGRVHPPENGLLAALAEKLPVIGDLFSLVSFLRSPLTLEWLYWPAPTDNSSTT